MVSRFDSNTSYLVILRSHKNGEEPMATWDAPQVPKKHTCVLLSTWHGNHVDSSREKGREAQGGQDGKALNGNTPQNQHNLTTKLQLHPTAAKNNV